MFGFAAFGLGYLLLGPTPVVTFLPSKYAIDCIN